MAKDNKQGNTQQNDGNQKGGNDQATTQNDGNQNGGRK